MTDELLNAVIQLEAEIQQQLETERRRADAWLEGVRKGLAEEYEQAIAQLKRGYRQAYEAAEAQASEQAEALLAEENCYCRRLEEIDDETLIEVLRQELVNALLEPSDDPQDGES